MTPQNENMKKERIVLQSELTALFPASTNRFKIAELISLDLLHVKRENDALRIFETLERHNKLSFNQRRRHDAVVAMVRDLFPSTVEIKHDTPLALFPCSDDWSQRSRRVDLVVTDFEQKQIHLIEVTVVKDDTLVERVAEKQLKVNILKRQKCI